MTFLKGVPFDLILDLILDLIAGSFFSQRSYIFLIISVEPESAPTVRKPHFPQ